MSNEVRNISDTAMWAALYRARETARRNGLFRDPLAERLAGERGKAIAEKMGNKSAEWAWVTRTVLFDRVIEKEIAGGAEMIVNLAAGLDTRPYRMDVPRSLQWVEVYLPEILEYKESIIGNEMPGCALERVALDLTNLEARRELFARLGARAKRALVITEGLLIYLKAEDVATLAKDLAPHFSHWVAELTSPGLLKRLQSVIGRPLDEARAPLQFGPEEGPEFFTPYGWTPVEVHSMFKTAVKLRRAPILMWPFALIPESNGRQGNRPWSGVCLFKSTRA
jgi:methyltransferase (TIGR00027 family)